MLSLAAFPMTSDKPLIVTEVFRKGVWGRVKWMVRHALSILLVEISDLRTADRERNNNQAKGRVWLKDGKVKCFMFQECEAGKFKLNCLTVLSMVLSEC
mgnify:FL=1